jgi:hypothetical protein
VHEKVIHFGDFNDVIGELRYDFIAFGNDGNDDAFAGFTSWILLTTFS